MIMNPMNPITEEEMKEYAEEADFLRGKFKVLVFMTHELFECGYPTNTFIVPADFNEEDKKKEWDKETGINQHDESEFFGRKHTMSFYEWMKTKYKEVEFVESNTFLL